MTTNNNKVGPSEKALQAISRIEERLQQKYREDLEARGLTNAKPPSAVRSTEGLELEDRGGGDSSDTYKPLIVSIQGKESFTSLNKGHEKITGPSRLGDGKGGTYEAPGAGSVRGPSQEALAKGEERARELARQKAEQLAKEEEYRSQFNPETIVAQLQYLQRQLKKQAKEINDLRKANKPTE